ncbi:MAG: DUF4132 domain-containing protein [Polyangiales bacterium]
MPSAVDYAKPFLEWTDELKKHVLPHRGMEPPARARPRLKASTVFKSGVAALAEDPPRWAAGEALAKSADKELLARVRGRLAGEEPTGFDAELEAACLHVSVAYVTMQRRESISARAVHLWAQKYGLLAAFKALVRSTEFRFLIYDSKRKPAARFDLSPHKDPHAHRWSGDAWTALRHLMAFAPQGEYEEARAWLREWSSGFDAGHQAYVFAAFVLSEDADLRAAVFASKAYGWGLFAMATNVDEAKAALTWRRSGTRYDQALTLVWRVGLDVLPLLLTHRRPSAEWARTMSVFVGVEPARAMASLIQDKSVRPILSSYFERHPELGRMVLPEVIAATKKKGPREAAKVMLANLEAETPIAQGLGPIASEEALPAVLRAPPWRSKRKAAVQASFELPLLDLPAELALDESEQKTLAAGARAVRPGTQAQLDKTLARPKLNIWELSHVYDDETLMRCIATISGEERWRWNYADQVRSFVARLGPDVAPYVASMVTQPETITGLRDLGTPKIAALMAAAAFKAKTKRVARGWLLRFPSHAAAGLLPDAFGADKKRRKVATAALRLLVAAGEGEVIKSIGGDIAGANAAELDAAELNAAELNAAVAALVDADPLLDAPTRPPKIPSWVDLERLPRPRLTSGEALSEESTKYLLEMLIFSEVDPPYAGIEQVAERLDDASANAFASGLCSACASAGAKPAWKWAAHSLGHLGNDESARWLVSQINAWAADGGKAVSLAGLEALGMIGSEVALMPLGRWSRRGRSWLKKAAQQVLGDIAAERGLSADELEDQTAPSLGLDAGGSLTLDYGPRRFTVTFDEHLHPLIHDEAGERVAKIPAVRKSDDGALAKAAKKTWSTLKKDAEALAKDQVERLQRAMASERSWSAHEFEKHLVGHPFVGHLARRLVFAHARSGAPLTTFRVRDDLGYSNAADDDVTLAADARISVVHPVHISDDELKQWGSLFADYEIGQPFAQLGRPVHRPSAADVGEFELVRAHDIKAYTGRIFALKTRGWTLGGDPYAFVSASKELAPGVSAAILWKEPIEMGNPEMREHTVTGVRIHGELTLDKLDPLLFSEFVTDVESLRS